MNVSKGYGFISYADFDASDAAIESMDGQFLLNKPVTVQYAYKKDGKGERHGDQAERELAAQAKRNNVQPTIQPLPPQLTGGTPAAPSAMANGNANMNGGPPTGFQGAPPPGFPGGPPTGGPSPRPPSANPLPPPSSALPPRPPPSQAGYGGPPGFSFQSAPPQPPQGFGAPPGFPPPPAPPPGFAPPGQYPPQQYGR